MIYIHVCVCDIDNDTANNRYETIWHRRPHRIRSYVVFLQTRLHGEGRDKSRKLGDSSSQNSRKRRFIEIFMDIKG